MTMVSRRNFVTGGACLCAVGAHGPVSARVAPGSMSSLVATGYRPADPDEKGIWQQVTRLEEEIASSNLLVNAPAMHDYTVAIIQRLLGDRARDVRVYLVNDPDFNASMAMNGMMIVHTGLLARVRNEAQYAAVLGHEAGHYLRRHQVARWRDHKTKTGIMAFVSAGTNVLAGAATLAGGNGGSWIDLANSINTSLAASIFSFSREQESEADAYGLRLIEEAGYAPEAAGAIWLQLDEERRASATARHKRYRDTSRSIVSTHPPGDVRMLDLATSAREMQAIAVSGRAYADGRDAWRQAIAPLRTALLDEQIKLNDPGASLYLIHALAKDGWDGTLRHCEGEVYSLRDEPGDAAKAATAYAMAVEQGDTPPEAWRAHGYALLKSARGEDGKRALARYLELKPGARDAAMVRFSLNQ